jgi:hypothetical protein
MTLAAPNSRKDSVVDLFEHLADDGSAEFVL